MRIRTAGAAALLALAFAAAGAEGGKAGEKVALDQLPAKVRSATDKLVGTGKVDEVRKEVADGKTVYHVDYRSAEGRKETVFLGEDGMPTAHDTKKDHPATK
jgi:hypothetical protein